MGSKGKGTGHFGDTAKLPFRDYDSLHSHSSMCVPVSPEALSTVRIVFQLFVSPTDSEAHYLPTQC